MSLSLYIFALYHIVLPVYSITPDSEAYRVLIDCHERIRREASLGFLTVNGVRKPTAGNMMRLTWDIPKSHESRRYAESQKALDCSTQTEYNVYHEESANLTAAELSRNACHAWRKQLWRMNWHPERVTGEQVDAMRDGLQMIFAGATKIGCGVHVTEQHSILACNYDAIVTKGCRIYATGTSCALCPYGAECDGWEGFCRWKK